MNELETLLKSLDTENKIIKLLCSEVIIQKAKIAELEKNIHTKEREYLTEYETMEHFKTSRTTLWRLVKFGKLVCYKKGHKNSYKISELRQTFSEPQNFYYGNKR